MILSWLCPWQEHNTTLCIFVRPQHNSNSTTATRHHDYLANVVRHTCVTGRRSVARGSRHYRAWVATRLGARNAALLPLMTEGNSRGALQPCLIHSRSSYCLVAHSQLTMNLLSNIYLSSAKLPVLNSICGIVLWSICKYMNDVFEHEPFA